MQRRISRRPLDGGDFDVIVIGGGINGVAIARECAKGGRRTLLLESHDFGSGTTSRSTRIIHGGLRYLEHGEISLVRESLRERQRLLSTRGHLVRPLTFLLALPDGGGWRRSSLAVRFGLALYGRMARPKNVRDSNSEIAAFEHRIDSGAKWTLFDYEDAQCEFPERLVAEWLVEAMAAGAVVRNYAEVLEIVVREGGTQGVFVRDVLTGEEAFVKAKHVVNAAGPWVDRVCSQVSGSSGFGRMVGGVRGTHIVLAHFEGAPTAAVYTEAEDRRPVFVLPWNGEVLVGTTEIADDGNPSDVAPTGEEIEYLFRSVRRLFPADRIDPGMVRYAFAGIRPLPFSPGKPFSAVTRRHLLHDHSCEGAAGLISVVGGKLTTAASLARQCARKLGIRAQEPSLPQIAPTSLNGMDVVLKQWARAVAASTGLAESSAQGIAEWHGPGAFAITRMVRDERDLRVPLCPHTQHVVAEAVHAARHEGAVTLADILLRRVPVALASSWDDSCTRIAAGAIASALGWPERDTGLEIENFEAERSRFLRKPGALSGPVVDTSTLAERAA